MVLVPVLGRPEKLAHVANSLRAVSPGCQLVFICSAEREDDVRAAYATWASVLLAHWKPGAGDFAKKIELGYRSSGEEWIFQGATDIEFTVGWDAALMRCAEKTGAKVIGTQDNANPMVKRGRHSTHTLIERAYCDDPGASFDGPRTVFSTAYDHQSVDNELLFLAQRRGVWTFCPDAVVIHRHPFYDRSVPRDPTYDKGLEKGREDARLFAHRKREWLRSQS